jgi:cytochrome bd-type quinol oxidase subunit 2
MFALIFRGVAFEFRNRATRQCGRWNWGFFLGSAI